MRSPLIQNVIGAVLPRIARGEGVWLFDAQGKRYFDACSGAVVTSIGHSHPRVVAAIAEQAARVTFAHRGAFSSSPLEAVAERLCALTGYAGAWFVSSGSEAVEAALQFALQYFRETGHPERNWFLSHRHGYHGNTMGGLSLSGHTRRAVIGELAHRFPVLETPRPDSDLPTLIAGVRRAIAEGNGHVAGIVIEPVGGATLGATVPPDGYLAALRKICDETGTLLILDEVMTGMGRMGDVLCSRRWGVEADIVALGKGLGAGYTPIAAALVNDRVLSAAERGSGRIAGGHTYGGNPLSAATALAVLDVLAEDDVIARSRHTGELLLAGLHGLAERHRAITDVRGLGMLLAMEFETPPDATPGRAAAEFAAIAQEEGVIVYPASGGFNDAVLIAPPLTTTSDEVETLIDLLDTALTSWRARR